MTKLYFAIDDALVVLTTEGEHARCDVHLKGSDIGCVTVDPLHPQLVYCGTLGSGLWRSDNAGESWRPAGEGIRHSRVQSVTVSRSEQVKGRGVVYAGTEPSAIFRSEDGGDTWIECSDLASLPSASEWSFPPRPETHHVRWIEADPHAATAISRAATVATPGNNTKKGCGTDTSGVLPWIRQTRITLFFRQPHRRGSLTLGLQNRISIGALSVRRGRNSVMASPNRPDATAPFWPPIRTNRERSSRLGSATYFVQSTVARTGIVWM